MQSPARPLPVPYPLSRSEAPLPPAAGTRPAPENNAEVQSGQQYYLPLKRDDYASGLYYCRLIANGQVKNLRLSLVK